MAASGTPMRTLQHWMGHADSKTTQIYAHYQPSDQEADAVDRAFAWLIGPFSLKRGHRTPGGRIVRAGAGASDHRARLPTRKLASRVDATHIEIDGLVFDRADADADGDVLHLARGESAEASDAALTPAGHDIRCDAEGRVIGVTIINARLLLNRDGHLTITLPHEVHVDASDLAGALS
jgi:uncharacterized protein YuzE